MKRGYPTKGQRTPYRIHFTRKAMECQAQMHKIIIRFGIFSARETKNLPGPRREGFYRFFLRFRSQRNPPAPTAASSSQIQSPEPEDVTKIAVGPSAPPMTPMLSAFAVAVNEITSFFFYFTPSDRTCQSFPRPAPLTFPPAGGNIIRYSRFICCHFREGFSVPLSLRTRPLKWCGNPFYKSRFTCFYKSWIRRNAPPRVPPRVKIRGICGCGGIGRLIGFRCCHLSEGFN